MSHPHHLLVFYVPEAQAESVKAAVFAAGAGRLGNYDCCCWQTSGVGQFRPQEGSQPFIGSRGEVEKVAEIRIEMVCSPACLPAVIDALKQAHPYETPAFAHWPIEGVGEAGKQ